MPANARYLRRRGGGREGSTAPVAYIGHRFLLAGIGHSSGIPALRSPVKYVASNKARVLEDSDLNHPEAFISAMLEKEPSRRSLRAAESSAAARSKSPLRP